MRQFQRSRFGYLSTELLLKKRIEILKIEEERRSAVDRCQELGQKFVGKSTIRMRTVSEAMKNRAIS